MTDPCFDFEKLDQVLGGEVSAATKEHLESCPRCRSRLTLYRSYVNLHGGAADPSESAAAAELQGMLEREIHRSMVPVETEASTVSWLDWLKGWMQPRRLAPALGALSLLIAAVLVLQTWQPWTAERITLREGGDGVNHRIIKLRQATVVSENKVELRWEAVRTADSYQVRFLSSRFEEVACFEAGRDTVLVFNASMIQPSAGASPASLWMVEAFESGDRIAESAPSILPPLEP